MKKIISLLDVKKTKINFKNQLRLVQYLVTVSLKKNTLFLKYRLLFSVQHENNL